MIITKKIIENKSFENRTNPRSFIEFQISGICSVMLF